MPISSLRYLSKKVSGDTGQKVTACMLKTFNRMKKRIGFLIYQFVLPALQVRRRENSTEFYA